MCTVLPPSGVNPIADKKHIIDQKEKILLSTTIFTAFL